MTRTVTWRVVAMSALAIAAVGCDSADMLGSSAYDEASLIVFYSDTSDIVAPDTVVRGTDFTVMFHTFGGGCLRQAASTNVKTLGSTSTIVPFDQNNGLDACTRELAFLPHSARVRFDTPGNATVRLVGQQRDSQAGNRPAELTHNVYVR